MFFLPYVFVLFSRILLAFGRFVGIFSGPQGICRSLASGKNGSDLVGFRSTGCLSFLEGRKGSPGLQKLLAV